MASSTWRFSWGGEAAWPGSRGAGQADYGWSYGAQTRMLVAYSLDGTAELPPQMEPYVPEPIEADLQVVNRFAAFGERLYGLCAGCHGIGAIAGGMAPDLRASYLVTSEELFAGVVRDGDRAVGGMPAYADMTDAMLLALRHYIRREAERALETAAVPR